MKKQLLIYSAGLLALLACSQPASDGILDPETGNVNVGGIDSDGQDNNGTGNNNTGGNGTDVNGGTNVTGGDTGGNTGGNTGGDTGGNTGGNSGGIVVTETENRIVYIQPVPGQNAVQGSDVMDYVDFRDRVDAQGADISTVAITDARVTLGNRPQDITFVENNASTGVVVKVYESYAGGAQTLLMSTEEHTRTLNQLLGTGLELGTDFSVSEDYFIFESRLRSSSSTSSEFTIVVELSEPVNGMPGDFLELGFNVTVTAKTAN